MKHSVVPLAMAGIILLLIAAVPVAATSTSISGDSITSIYPSVGYADGKTVTYTITGVNFTTVSGEVRLEMDDESDIDATITSWDVNTIVCRFKLSSSKEPGSWDLVVVKSYDDTTIIKTDAFTIADPVTLTSISPTSGEVDDADVDFTLTGTDFDEDLIEDVFLYNEDYDNISADYDVSSTTKITGTFDLSDAEEDTYDVCVEDTYGTDFCDLSFEIVTNEYGTLDISSSPSGAAISIDGSSSGTTPNTVEDVLVGSHKIIIQKSGYQEWGKIVSVTSDDTTEVDATLYALATATPLPTTQPTTVRTTAKSTIKVPTTWADTPVPTTTSPVDPTIVIGAAGIGMGLVILRRR